MCFRLAGGMGSSLLSRFVQNLSFFSEGLLGWKESVGEEDAGGEGNEDHEGRAAAFSGEDAFAGDPLVEHGEDFTAGDEDDDAAGDDHGAGAARDSGEEVGKDSRGEGAKKDAGEGSEVVPAKRGKGIGVDEREHGPANFAKRNIECDP